MRLKALCLGSAVAAATMAGAAAHATPLSTPTFSVSVYSALTPNSSIGSSNQQALPTNPIVTGSNEIASFTLAGLPQWFVGASTTNSLGNFVGASLSNSVWTAPSNISNLAFMNGGSFGSILSTPNFGSATIFDLALNGNTGTLANPLTLTITHDDGMSLFASNYQYTAASGPVYVDTTTFTIPAGTTGPYNLWYLEANGAPSALEVSVPEPGTVSLFAMALLSLGFVAYRRRM